MKELNLAKIAELLRSLAAELEPVNAPAEIIEEDLFGNTKKNNSPKRDRLKVSKAIKVLFDGSKNVTKFNTLTDIMSIVYGLSSDEVKKQGVSAHNKNNSPEEYMNKLAEKLNSLSDKKKVVYIEKVFDGKTYTWGQKQ